MRARRSRNSNGGTFSSVISWRVRSRLRRAVQTRSGRSAKAASSEASHVVEATVPAFRHWDSKPSAELSGTSSNWSLTSRST